MERGKYHMTRRGQVSALRNRRMRRVMVRLEQQPQSKNIKPGDAEAFRTAILERLEKFGQAAFRGDVLLQMDFITTAKDPPAIYKLPKNYIDLSALAAANTDIVLVRYSYCGTLTKTDFLDGTSTDPGTWELGEATIVGAQYPADAYLVKTSADASLEHVMQIHAAFNSGTPYAFFVQNISNQPRFP